MPVGAGRRRLSTNRLETSIASAPSVDESITTQTGKSAPAATGISSTLWPKAQNRCCRMLRSVAAERARTSATVSRTRPPRSRRETPHKGGSLLAYACHIHRTPSRLWATPSSPQPCWFASRTTPKSPSTPTSRRRVSTWPTPTALSAATPRTTRSRPARPPPSRPEHPVRQRPSRAAGGPLIRSQ